MSEPRKNNEKVARKAVLASNKYLEMNLQLINSSPEILEKKIDCNCDERNRKHLLEYLQTFLYVDTRRNLSLKANQIHSNFVMKFY